MRGRASAHWITPRERDAALAHLKRNARDNLLLMEMVAGVGQSGASGEPAAQVVAVWDGGEIIGVASLRPSVVLDADMGQTALEAVLPMVASLETGLIKSPCELAGAAWDALRRRGRRALIDRLETAYVRRADPPYPPPRLEPGCRLRCAEEGDLEALVEAARASLREESRPDPFDGDPAGFRRWVRGRVPRARLVDEGGRPTFVGYVDVRRPEGWLIQGVYTWPAWRRRGHARAGMTGMLDEAFAAGADHVQLAVVEGNEPAVRLYEGLGFSPAGDLRTILFH